MGARYSLATKTDWLTPKFALHGKYCGPGYCGGSFEEPCDYSVEPVDKLDEACRNHDYGYELGEYTDSNIGFVDELSRIGFDDLDFASYTKKHLAQSYFDESLDMSKGQKAKRAAKSKKAPRQSRGSNAPRAAPVAISAPSRRPARMRVSRGGGSGVTVSGQEPIGQLSGLTTDGNGTLSFSFGLSPSNFNSRLQLYAQLYERFEFEAVQIEYRPAVPTSQAGSWVGYFETDPAAAGANPSGQASYYIASSHETSQTFNAWAPAVIKYKRPANIASFYCYNDDNDYGRMTTQAVFRVIVETPSGANNVIMGQFHLHYRIRFYVEQFEPLSAPATAIAETQWTAAASTQATMNNYGDWNLVTSSWTNANFSTQTITLSFPLANTTYWLYASGRYSCATAASNVAFSTINNTNCTVSIPSGRWVAGFDGTGCTMGGRLKVVTNGIGTASCQVGFVASMAMSGSNVGDNLFVLFAVPTGILPNATHPDAVGFRYRKIRQASSGTEDSRIRLLEEQVQRLLSLPRGIVVPSAIDDYDNDRLKRREESRGSTSSSSTLSDSQFERVAATAALEAARALQRRA